MYFNINPINLLRALSLALELASGGLSRHHWRTAIIADRIAEEINLVDKERQQLIYAALLHDIGAASSWSEKHQIRNYANPLLHKHAEVGYELLKDSAQLGYLADTIRHHHDLWDGSSPASFVGQEIPLLSRIISLADRVEVLLRDDQFIFDQRPVILATIRQSSGISFDPDLVQALHEISRQESFWLDLVNSRYYQNFFQQLESYGSTRFNLDDVMNISEIFATIIDRTSRFTAAHSRSVSTVAAFLASSMGFCADEVKVMRIAGLMHDLGKLAVSSGILEKNGKLTVHEYHIIKQHPYYTYRILNEIDGFHTIAEWAAYHHETLDGKGYPFCIQESSLSLGSRIMAVADIFTALTENRPYRATLEITKVEKIMQTMVANHKIDDQITAKLFSNSQQVRDLKQQVLEQTFY
ncbi:HD-GYP domain-containing protein (c-di-GMP phosphodiesterase class II) [Sporomusaceae bacterium BoRhaA]|uniref:HD domain-containing phosphohydrolase n=1 Tax=Pelorhabdus rhamnosifermentans TaxID=2772457 RepID=UPI001C062CFF|nr:HD domain-containing phosphohydrolase [Pelorhabdus rhamnosifermentans]MBU2700619.1 HD-GYP domain-containing protein (c-di-GMP phosphodiesterase class II) [Pelorhabdus rhamnosifermentans]